VEEARMIATIDLTPEQEDVLQDVAARSSTAQPLVLHDLPLRLPDGNVITVDITPKLKPAAIRKTPEEMIAGWKASGMPSVYGRDIRDSEVIARELRARAEKRDWPEE
jgi:hypothetical protein